jgi:hypothetical protein
MSKHLKHSSALFLNENQLIRERLMAFVVLGIKQSSNFNNTKTHGGGQKVPDSAFYHKINVL